MPSYYSEKADSNSADNAGTARKQLLFEPLFLDQSKTGGGDFNYRIILHMSGRRGEYNVVDYFAEHRENLSGG